MRDKHLAAVTAILLVVAAAGIALTAGGQQGAPQATAADTTDETTDATGVTLHGVTVERLRLQDTNVTNATVNRLTVAEVTSENRTITNGTFVDVEIQSLQLEGVTADDLTSQGAAPEGMPGAANETMPAGEANMTETPMGEETETPMGEETATPTVAGEGTEPLLAQENETETPGGETTPATGAQNETEEVESVRIAMLSVQQLEVDSLSYEESADAAEQPMPAGEAGTPGDATPGDATPGAETPGQETPGAPGTPTEAVSPMMAQENETTPGDGEMTPDEGETTTDDGEMTPDDGEMTPGAGGGQAGAGQTVVVPMVNVTHLSVGEMVVTTSMGANETGNATGAATPGGAGQPNTTQAGPPGGQGNAQAGGPATAAEPTAVQVDNATADRATARLTTEYGQFHLANVSVPDEIQAGENFTATLTLVNADDQRGVEYIGYQVGTTAMTRELVVLEPGERQEVTINVSTEDLMAGTYTQQIESQRTTVTLPLTVQNGEDNATAVATPNETMTPGETETPEEETPGGETPTDATPEEETPGGETPTEATPGAGGVTTTDGGL